MPSPSPIDDARAEARLHTAEELERSAIELLIKTNVAFAEFRVKLEAADRQNIALMEKLAANIEQTKTLATAMATTDTKMAAMQEQIKPLVKSHDKAIALIWALVIMGGGLMVLGQQIASLYKWLSEHFRGGAAL